MPKVQSCYSLQASTTLTDDKGAPTSKLPLEGTIKVEYALGAHFLLRLLVVAITSCS